MRRRLLVAFPVLVALLVHGSAVRHEFLVWDDPAYATENPVIQTFDCSTLREVLDPTMRTLSAWTPTTLLTYALELRVAGPDPRVFHATNVLLHALNALLVALLLARLGLGLVGAAAGAALFAAHPLHVESVAWVSGRKELLAGALAFGSMLLYLRSTPAARAGSLGLFLLGLGAKASAVVVPFLLLMLHAVRRERPSRGEWRLLAGMGLLAAARAVLEIVSQADAAAGTAALGTGPRLGAMVGVLGRYAQRWIWPADLAAAYPVALADAGTIVSGALLLCAALAAAWFSRGRPALQAGLLWWPVALFPVLNVLPAPPLEADRYQYLALVGPAVWAGWLIEQLSGRNRAIAALLLAAALVGLGVQSRSIHANWRSSEAFFEAQLQENPEWWVGRLLRAVWHTDEGRLDAAERDATTVREALPGFGRAAHVLGLVDEKRGDLDGAVRSQQEALALDPSITPAWAHLCALYAMRGEHDRAVPSCTTALARDRHQPAVRHTLALVYVALGNSADERGRLDEALQRYADALALEPELPEAHYNLAIALHRTGRLEQALTHYERALAARPGDADALAQLATALRRLGRLEPAREAYVKSLEVDPTGAEARYGLALLLAGSGELEAAREHFVKLLELHPDLHAARGALVRIEQALAAEGENREGRP